MRYYRCLNNSIFRNKEATLVPIRDEDKHKIRQWRNEQMYHLRQTQSLTEESQNQYFSAIISDLFTQEKPSQLLFSYLQNEICIGYGGLVHINWESRQAEVSFIMETDLEKDFFQLHWANYLELLDKLAFEELNFDKIFTFAFDLRPHLYPILERAGFLFEARLKKYYFFEGKYIDAVIHSKNSEKLFYRMATKSDIDLYFDWANESQTRLNSFDSKLIDYEQHKEWFFSALEDKNIFLFLFYTNKNQPVGQVRIENKNGESKIGISLDKKFRGKSLASKLIKIASDDYFKVQGKPIFAYIKKINVPSIKAFEKADYKFINQIEVNSVETLVFCKGN